MWQLILYACLYLVPGNCSWIPEPKFEDTDKTVLHIADSRFAGVTPTIEARRYYCAHQESVYWTDYSRFVHLVLSEFRAGCTLNGGAKTEAEEIARFSWLAQATFDHVEDPYTVQTPLGLFHVRQFRRDERFCFFIYNALGNEVTADATGRKRRIVGYSCGPPRVSNARIEIGRFIESISVLDKPWSGRTADVEKNSAPEPTVAAPKIERHELRGNWHGVSSDLSVVVHRSGKEEGGHLTLRSDANDIECEGLWLDAGSWSASCSNDRIITGTGFRFRDGASFGAGKDDLGREVRFGVN